MQCHMALKNGCATALEVHAVGATPKSEVGSRLGRSDAHGDGRIS
jgi:hypothetical protein